MLFWKLPLKVAGSEAYRLTRHWKPVTARDALTRPCSTTMSPGRTGMESDRTRVDPDAADSDTLSAARPESTFPAVVSRTAVAVAPAVCDSTHPAGWVGSVSETSSNPPFGTKLLENDAIDRCPVVIDLGAIFSE